MHWHTLGHASEQSICEECGNGAGVRRQNFEMLKTLSDVPIIRKHFVHSPQTLWTVQACHNIARFAILCKALFTICTRCASTHIGKPHSIVVLSPGYCPVYFASRWHEQFTFSQFVWANGRAARIGITIPVCSIVRLPLLEPLPSLPNIKWKRRQSFRNKMAEAANKRHLKNVFFFNLTFVFVVKYKSSCLYFVIRLLILKIHFGVVNIW